MIGIINEIFTAPNPNLIAGDFGEWSDWKSFSGNTNSAGDKRFNLHYGAEGVSKGTRLSCSVELDADGMESLSSLDNAFFGVLRGDITTEGQPKYAMHNVAGLDKLSDFPASGLFRAAFPFVTNYDFSDMSIFFGWHNLKGRFRFRRLKVERGSWSPYVMGGVGRNSLCVITLRHIPQGRAAA